MASSTLFQFDVRHHAVVNLLVLGATLVLPLVRVSWLKLRKQRAKIVLPNCACHLAQMSLGLYSKGSCARITTLGQLVSSCYRLKLLLNRDCAVPKEWSCEVVGNQQFSQVDTGLCWGRSGFSDCYVTFHCPWQICPVRRQPSCSGKSACLGNHPSLANRTGFIFEFMVARCRNCSGPFEARFLKQSRLQPSSKLVLDAVERSEAIKL